MAVFLLILKYIGITILVILALLLLILLLVLFVPVRYKVYGTVDRTDLENEKDKLKDRVHLKASFRWLLYLVRGSFEFPSDDSFSVKVLFFTVFPRKEKNSGADSDSAIEEKDDGSVVADDGDKVTEMEDFSGLESHKDSPLEAEITSETNADPKVEEASLIEGQAPPETEAEEPTKDQLVEEQYERDYEDEKEGGFFSLLAKIFETICKIIKMPQVVFQKIQCTISSICAKIDMIKNTLNNDIFKRAFKVSKKQLRRVIKAVWPKKIKAHVHLGMNDVASTADIFSAYGMMYPILAGKVYLTPDFERAVIEGDMDIKGRIRIITIIWAAAVVYFNKDIRKTVRRFKKIINS